MRIFAHLCLASIALIGCGLPALAAPPAGVAAPAAAAKRAYKVTGLRGYLYYDADGSFDTRDLFKLEAGSLHNTVIGEGIAKGPSNTTLLQVEVSGPGFGLWDVGVLTVKATTVHINAQNKPVTVTLLQQSVDLDTYYQDQGQRILVPFLLYSTGSGPITITASLKPGKDTDGKPSSLSKQILFGGGE